VPLSPVVLSRRCTFRGANATIGVGAPALLLAWCRSTTFAGRSGIQVRWVNPGSLCGSGPSVRFQRTQLAPGQVPQSLAAVRTRVLTRKGGDLELYPLVVAGARPVPHHFGPGFTREFVRCERPLPELAHELRASILYRMELVEESGADASQEERARSPSELVRHSAGAGPSPGGEMP